MEPQSKTGHFFFLCQKKRQEVYRQILRWLPYRIVFIDDLEQLLGYLLETPPDAVLIDVVTNMRFGSAQMAPIHNLDLSWPVLLCNVTPEGSAQVMCMALGKNADMPSALEAIVNKDASWVNSRSPRRFVRVDVECRLLLRRTSSDVWMRSNILNLSAGGFFAVSYELIIPGTEVEFEILDIHSEPVCGTGTVAWVRSWDDNISMPGLGIQFVENSAALASVRNFLKSKEAMERFCTRFREQYN